MRHRKDVEIRWRDCDAYGHVNNAVYATYLEECRDEWLNRALGDEAAAWDYVLARVAIDFRHELVLDDDAVTVEVSLARIGNSSLGLRETVHRRDGTLAAEAESVLVARDRERGVSRPLTAEERATFERCLVPAER